MSSFSIFSRCFFAFLISFNISNCSFDFFILFPLFPSGICLLGSRISPFDQQAQHIQFYWEVERVYITYKRQQENDLDPPYLVHYTQYIGTSQTSTYSSSSMSSPWTSKAESFLSIPCPRWSFMAATSAWMDTIFSVLWPLSSLSLSYSLPAASTLCNN